MTRSRFHRETDKLIRKTLREHGTEPVKSEPSPEETKIMTKLRELALKSILSASSWLDKDKDERTLNYLRLAKESIKLDTVHDEARALGLNIGYGDPRGGRTLPLHMIRDMIAERKKYATHEEYIEAKREAWRKEQRKL